MNLVLLENHRRLTYCDGKCFGKKKELKFKKMKSKIFKFLCKIATNIEF